MLSIQQLIEEGTLNSSVYANVGTALKPGIKFEPREKKNTCLTVRADIPFVKQNLHPTPEFVKHRHGSDYTRQQHQPSLCRQLCE